MITHKQLAITDRLVPILKKSTGQEVVSTGEVKVQQISTGGGFNDGIFRYSGTATAKNGEVPWSIIVKVISPNNPSLPADKDDPASWGYWKREAALYNSDILADLPVGLSVPRLFEIEEHADGSVGLWMEEVQGDTSPWTPDIVRRAGKAAGYFNGQYLVGKKIPETPWLSHGWLRSAIAENEIWFAKLRENLSLPGVQAFFPADIAEVVFHVWDQRHVYLDALDRLPQTLCHMDYFVRNLVRRQGQAGEEFVAFDWAYTGIGAVGEELTPLIVGSMSLVGIEMKYESAIEREAFAGYTAGLAEAGWQGDQDLVWAGYSLSGALRYPCGVLNVLLPNLLNPALDLNTVGPFGMTILEFAEHIRRVNRQFLIRLAREADRVAAGA